MPSAEIKKSITQLRPVKSNQYINIKKKKEENNTAEMWSYHYCCHLLSWRRGSESKRLVQGHAGSAGGKIWIWSQLESEILFFLAGFKFMQCLQFEWNLGLIKTWEWASKTGWDLNRLPLHQSHWCQCLPTLTQKMYNVKINAMGMNNYRVGWGLRN